MLVILQYIFCIQFHKWLERIVSGHQQYANINGLIDKLENQGILTFESLFRYVLCKQDLIKIIGKEFSKIHNMLWQEIQNQQSDLMTDVIAPNAAFSTPNGYDDGNQQNNNKDEDGDGEGKVAATHLHLH